MNPITLKVCTYNIRDLFLAGEGQATPKQRVRHLARMIDQVDADLVILQEVGSQASLEELNRRLGKPYPHQVLLVGNSNRSIHVAAFGRIPMRGQSHRDVVLQSDAGEAMQYYVCQEDAELMRASPLGFQRDLLRLVLDTQPVMVVFGVHLKSRTNVAWQMHGSDVIRAAECRAIQRLIETYRDEHPEHFVLLAGDFNDRLSSDALLPVAELGFADPLGQRLKVTGRNPSTYWPKRRMRIDGILVSQNAQNHVIDDSPTIHVSGMAREASDHYPVSLSLNVCQRS